MSTVIKNHPQRTEINDLLMSGVSPAKVAEKFGLNKTTAYRYRNLELKPAIAAINPNLIMVKSDISTSKDGNLDQDEGLSRMNDARVSQMQNSRLSIAAQYIQRISAYDAKRDLMLDHAVAEKDVRGFAAVDTRILSAIELQAKLAGALSPDSTQITNNIAVMSFTEDASRERQDDAGDVIDIQPMDMDQSEDGEL